MIINKEGNSNIEKIDNIKLLLNDYKTKENREMVAILSRKLNLGSENHIARIAFAYSISKTKLDL